MPQRKLDHYLQRPQQPRISSSGVSFLDLPGKVRRRIYLLAELVRFCPINFNQEGPRAYYYCNGGKIAIDSACVYKSRRFMGKQYVLDCIPGCQCSPLPFSLLYVSRSVSEEVMRILYSENTFTISRSDLWGLKPLRNLSTNALSCLRSITVRLNNCECVYGPSLRTQDCDGTEFPGLLPCHPLCRTLGIHDKPLQKRARQHAAILREWQQVVGRMVAHCRPGVLRLDLVCDTGDVLTAKVLLESLSSLPKVRACSIRLSQSPGWDLSALAGQTATQLLVGQSQEKALDNKQRPYQLPPEILTSILHHSELVAPYDLEWRSDKGLVPFDCCKKCTATLDCCACSFYHGAYSSTCTCWRLPLSIFLVSHQVYDIALSIFYQRNRFIILPQGGRLDDLGSCDMAMPALTSFLQRLPPHAIPLLRSLGVAFPPFKSLLASESHQLLVDWKNSLVSLSSQCNTKELALDLFMSDSMPFRGNEAYQRALRRNYKLFTKPLESLSGLYDLFIYLEWPEGSTSQSMVEYSNKLEKEIMGADYNSKARGKFIRLPQLWYNGECREGPVFTADGGQIWPRIYEKAAFDTFRTPPYTYI
jgi:hypothetical protein